jgi:4'-phosphopantetheinyl transferase
MHLAPSDVHLWRIRLDQPEDVHARLRDCLDDEEREKAARFRFPGRQRVACVSRGALREILAAYLGSLAHELRFGVNLHGKPFLSGSHAGLRFNLSHSGEWALVGVTLDAEIGVDIEAVSPDRRTADLAGRYFSTVEQAEFASLPEELRLLAFYCGWTRKEAYIKARGRGLSLPLDSFDVTLDPTCEARLCRAADDPDFGRWRLRALPAPEGFVAAAIVEGEKTVWSIGEWKPCAKNDAGSLESLS